MLLVSHVFAGASRADVTVNGNVTAADDGSALPGVNVYLKGTQTGTITDGDGKYSNQRKNRHRCKFTTQS